MSYDDMYPTIIEAAARAMWQVEWGTATWPPAEDPEGAESYRALARAAAPLIEAAYVRSRATIHVAAIEAAALERAAKVAEEYDGRGIEEDHAVLTCEEIAARIRALKEQP